MDLRNEAFNSLDRYFSYLTHTGYKKYSDVGKLVIFTFIEELLYGPLSEFISEKDYNIINQTLYDIYGSCLIPFPDYKQSVDPIHKKLFDKYRITGNNVNRITEFNLLRVKA